MTRENFHKSIALAKDHGEHITIGGGEPTLHPHFREFLMYAVWELADLAEEAGSSAVHLVTNGTQTETALTIAKLAKQGIISARVSRDQYHDASMIDPLVYKAFERPNEDRYHPTPAQERDGRGINGGEGFIIPVGRAKKWGNHPFIKCVCDSVFITPKGDVYPCGCQKTSLGNLSGEVAIRYEHLQGWCEKDEKYKTEVLDVIAENS